MHAERTAVITVVSGRHEHLAVQRHHLARCDPAPFLHVVVAVADPDVAEVASREPGLTTQIVALDSTPAGLPVAAARNAGAAAALGAGATQLVFLDVDCLPAADLLARYAGAVHDDAVLDDVVLCGPVTYLPPREGRDWRVDDPTLLRAPHAARPDPAPGTVVPLDPALFWSLSFALTAATWARLGGFWAGYVGYGAEDTDFGRHVAASGVPLLMAGGADAYHQHHPVSRPPVEHVDDIVRNSEIYLRRNGTLPMTGWLDAFRADGLIETGPSGAPRRSDAPRVLTVPARHPYLDAVLPASVVRVEPERVAGWEPDPMLAADTLADAADGIDVVHVHFGYDHVDPDALAGWLERLDELGLALAVTVHDLRNPHHADRRRHDAHLGLLLGHAHRAITLTDAAADECELRFGRRPEVVPHPTLLSAFDVPAALRRPLAAPRTVLVPLKALRRNVIDPDDVVRAAVAGAADARVVVLVQPSVAERPELAGTRAAAARGDLDLVVRDYLPADELHALVAASHAVVLPYRWGTHSGWAELARDLGTHVVAPSSGHVASQLAGTVVYGNDETDGLDAGGLQAAVAEVCRRPAAVPVDRAVREVERDLIRATHDALYRDLARRRSRPARVP